MTEAPWIRLEALGVRYGRGAHGVEALAGVNLELERGECVVLRGPSGAGKTTLLLALGGLLRPSEGRALYGQRDIYRLSGAERRRYRARTVGFVFQTMHLLPYLSVRANVELSLRHLGRGEARARSSRALEELGLSDRGGFRPTQLSAGERQRAAAARALAHEPGLILADEPTGNLDPDNAGRVLGALAERRKRGSTIVLVTHADCGPVGSNRELHLRRGVLSRSGAHSI